MNLGRTFFTGWPAARGREEPVDRWDAAFDAGKKVSQAGNVTALIGWRSHGRYTDDMRAMLLGAAATGATSRLPGHASAFPAVVQGTPRRVDQELSNATQPPVH